MRQRAAVIIFDKDRLALIKRVHNGKTYYVFPGGGIKAHENPLQAAQREAFEELGVQADIGPCIFELTGTSTEYYFLAEITGGQFGSGKGKEYTDTARERGSYEAVWLPFKLLHTVTLYPEAIQLKDLIKFTSVESGEKGILVRKTITI